MRERTKFRPLRRKAAGFAAFMITSMLLFCGIFWAENRALLGRQDRMLHVQCAYSELMGSMRQLDSYLYAYAQSRSEENRTACRALAAQAMEHARTLLALLDQPIFVDLFYLTDAYAAAADAMTARDGLTTGEYLSLYEETADQMACIEALSPHFTAAVDADRRACQAQLEDARRRMERVLTGVTALMIAGSVAAFVGTLSGIVRKLTLLTARAERICAGDWDVDVPEPTEARDEADVLARAFERMLRHIRAQMERQRQQEQLERAAQVREANIRARLEHAQLRALQSRVNPHFLFNALNVIAGQAADEGADRTLDIILRTADYLRYSLDNLDKIVTLEAEIRNVGDYFEIQARRFGTRIRFFLDWDEACAHARLPAMTLQPLCENALVHGVSAMVAGGEVRVFARRVGARVEVSAQDNGAGFSKARIDEVLERIRQEDYDDAAGVGVYNVMQRMNAFFGGEAECTIESRPNVQTTVTLSFPYREEGDGE